MPQATRGMTRLAATGCPCAAIARAAYRLVRIPTVTPEAALPPSTTCPGSTGKCYLRCSGTPQRHTPAATTVNLQEVAGAGCKPCQNRIHGIVGAQVVAKRRCRTNAPPSPTGPSLRIHGIAGGDPVDAQVVVRRTHKQRASIHAPLHRRHALHTRRSQSGHCDADVSALICA